MKFLHQRGKPVPVVLLLFVGGSAAYSVAQVKAASPNTTVIARIYKDGDYHANDKGGWDHVTRADGRAYFEARKHLITEDMARADFVQIADLNEPGEGTKINDWMHGILDGADAFNAFGRKGIKLAVYNFSVGNPGLPGDKLPDGSPRPYRDFWTWESTHTLLRRVKRDKHAFCLHQYAFNDDWTNEYSILRHRKIFALLPPDLRDMKVWFNEFCEGWMTFAPPRTPERYAQRLPAINEALRNSPGDGDGMAWTLGGKGTEWEPDMLEGILGVYVPFALT